MLVCWGCGLGGRQGDTLDYGHMCDERRCIDRNIGREYHQQPEKDRERERERGEGGGGREKIGNQVNVLRGR